MASAKLFILITCLTSSVLSFTKEECENAVFMKEESKCEENKGYPKLPILGNCTSFFSCITSSDGTQRREIVSGSTCEKNQIFDYVKLICVDVSKEDDLQNCAQIKCLELLNPDSVLLKNKTAKMLGEYTNDVQNNGHSNHDQNSPNPNDKGGYGSNDKKQEDKNDKGSHHGSHNNSARAGYINLLPLIASFIACTILKSFY